MKLCFLKFKISLGSTKQLNYLVLPPYFNLKHSGSPNSKLFIKFQCVWHEGVTNSVKQLNHFSESPEDFDLEKNKYFDIFGFLVSKGVYWNIKSPFLSSLEKCHFGAPLCPEVPDRGQNRVEHQKCSNKAKTLYPGILWGGEFNEIGNIWRNLKFFLFTGIFCHFRAQKVAQNYDYFQNKWKLSTRRFFEVVISMEMKVFDEKIVHSLGFLCKTLKS